ncbi:MAG TPA: MFS transporter [Candidatus Eisenbacteria bacterium]|nr:MFS transporter [Candidatus Eisenbacteria bacterium]
MVRHFLRDTYYTAREFSDNARLFLVSTFLSWAGYAVNQVLFNLYLTEGAYREAFIGRCLSMVGLGMGLAAVPAGFLSDRIGRRMCLLIGSLGLGASYCVRALSLDPAVLLTANFCAGAFFSLVTISTSPFLTENSETHVRSHLFSAHFVTTLTAGVVGNLLGGRIPELLLHHAPGLFPSLLSAYRWTLLASGVTTVMAVWPLLSVREVPPEIGDGSTPRTSYREAAPLLAKFGVIYMLIGTGAGLVIPFFNLYFARRFNCTSGQIGVFYSGSQVLTALVALAGPFLAKRFGALRSVTWLQLASLPFLVTLGFEKTLGVAVACFWARACLMQTASPLMNHFTMESVPADLRARTTGLTNSLWQLGWAASTSLSGVLMMRYGYDYPYYLTAILYGSAAVLFYRMFKARPAVAAVAGMGERKAAV